MDETVVLLTDPELFTEEDVPFFQHFTIVEAMNHFFGGRYTSVRAMLEARKRVETYLNGHMEDAQRALTPPCYVACAGNSSMPVLYGRVISNDEYVEQATRVGQEDEAQARKRIEDLNRRGWLFGEWFSQVVPDGEWGCNHRMQVVFAVDEDGFNEIKRLGWPRNGEGLEQWRREAP